MISRGKLGLITYEAYIELLINASFFFSSYKTYIAFNGHLQFGSL